MLGGSGHIAGIVNPPTATNKYCYWSNTEFPEDSDTWLATAGAPRRFVVERLAGLD